MIDDDKFFKKIELLSFPQIQNALLNLHKDKLFPIKKQAVNVIWSRENFLELHDELINIADDMHSTIIIAKFFITPPYSQLGVHVDNTTISNKPWALNIPILTHSDNHFMTWYDYTGEIDQLSNAAYYNSIQPKEVNKLILQEKLILNDPHYVKIGMFHGVKNPTPTPRIVLTIRFSNSFIV